MNTRIFSFLVGMALIFSACNKDLPDAGEVSEGGVKAKEAVSGVKWLGASDVAVAVNIDWTPSDRKNASGLKITSNAHSADFPGIYFIWDSKQKDHGYLKVDASVFEKYNGFILTAKMSNEYWDFRIEVQPGQALTGDGCYVFFIPKLLEKDSKGKLFNINMVFIGGWDQIITPVIPDKPIIKGDDCVQTYFIMSGPNHGTAVVDPGNSWKMPGESRDIKRQWSETIRGAYTADWNAMMAVSFSETVKDKVVTTSPTWVWDRQDSWDTGFSGSNIVKYIIKNFNLELDKVVEDVIPFYFACDNAAVVFVNGEKAAWTTAALNGFYVPEYGEEFTDFSATGFNGEPWSHLYHFDLKPLLNNGANEIVIIAANSDENNGRWNVDNNPAGLIYASKFTVDHKCVETRNIEVFEHKSGGQYGYVGMQYTDPPSNPIQLIPLAGNDYTYQIVDRKPWPAGTNNEAGILLPVIGTMNPVFNVLGNNTVEGQQFMARTGYYVVNAYDKVTGGLAIIFNIKINPAVQDQ